MRVWATKWVFPRTPSRGDRGRRAADIFREVFSYLSAGISFFFRFLCIERTRPTASTR